MREIIAVLGTLAFVVFVWSAASASSLSNDMMKWCLDKHDYSVEKFDTFNWSAAAACHSDFRIAKTKAEYAEMRDFLKHNPRYRYPGQSNNRCWGKPREMPFKSSYIERDGDGFRAGVSYKDTLSAGCFENAPWDNRHVKN